MLNAIEQINTGSMQISSLTLENNAPEVYYAKFKFKDENVPPSYIVFETKKES